jgi:hypothetical protein
MTEPDLHDKVIDKIFDRNKEEFSDLFDAAVDRWLDKQFTRFGKWALGGLAAAIFIWCVKMYVASGGTFK